MNASPLRKHDPEITQLYESGVSARDIGRRFDTSDSAISYRLMVNGVKKRTISEATKGKKVISEEQKAKQRIAAMAANPRGEKHHNWKGGKSSNWEKLKATSAWKGWRKAVFERDGYTCQGCGDGKGDNLHAHHILPRREFPLLTFAGTNGITLCRSCHEKTMGRESESEHVWVTIVRSKATQEES